MKKHVAWWGGEGEANKMFLLWYDSVRVVWAQGWGGVGNEVKALIWGTIL